MTQHDNPTALQLAKKEKIGWNKESTHAPSIGNLL
jgi:hypothetical protein